MSEIRTVILTSDGRTVTLGRVYQPTQDEISAARSILANDDSPAWLATIEGSLHAASPPKLTEVRALVGEGAFEDAVRAYEEARAARLARTDTRIRASAFAQSFTRDLGQRLEAAAYALMHHTEWQPGMRGLHGMLSVADALDAAALAYMLDGDAAAQERAREAAADMRAEVRHRLDNDAALDLLRPDVRRWLTNRAALPPGR